MKPNSYILTYWPRVQKEFRVDLQLLAQCLVDDCPEEAKNVDIDGILEYYEDHAGEYLMEFGFPPEELEEDGEFICENLYNETWEDLADIIDKLINLE